MRHRPATRDDLRRLALWLTMEERQLRALIDQAVNTARAVVASGELAAARATPECHEEVPFAVRAPEATGMHVVTGTIDLVHRQGAGWRVVDYKTDVESSTVVRRYAEQVRNYAEAWGRISGTKVETAIISAR
jgi:ATP-dependent exoDNAse (exonuclease V) beta subunit